METMLECSNVGQKKGRPQCRGTEGRPGAEDRLGGSDPANWLYSIIPVDAGIMAVT